MAYVPLWTKTNFSFLEGASHPEELVDQAAHLGLTALAITDRDGVHGVVRAHVRAKVVGLDLILGAQVTIGDSLECAAPVVLLARDRIGYGNLCGLISAGRQRCKKGESLLAVEELCVRTDGLLALCPTARLLEPLADAWAGRLYALCARHRRATDPDHEAHLREAAGRVGAPIAAAVEILYHGPSRRPLQDVLTCIRHKCTLATAGTRLRPNAEHGLHSVPAMYELFADDRAAVSRTCEIAERCSFTLDELRYRYPGEHIPEGRTEHDWLRELTYEGARHRYGGHVPDDVRHQIERELGLIHALDYGGYFLTMWEIVQFCRRNGILCQGRGSAANSAVCFCLGVTAIDPVRMGLLFERFLSRERAEPPDIDLDIEHARREEVIQWVYERYGRRHAAMVANVIRYRARSAVRDVGKAIGIPSTALDRLAKLLDHHGFEVKPEVLVHTGLDPTDRIHALLLRLVGEISDFPRHLSIHPGGFLLGSDPVDSIVPIEPATMEGRTVIQWDKYDIEALALFKVDLLGLGALTQIHGCFDLLREHEAIDIDMARVPAEDPATYAMISRADTIGVFQIESRAQMAMLPRLHPRTFYDLVIEVAIVRPGPIQGDMVHPYLRRRRGKEAVEFPHRALEPILSKTLGVPIFQEQVMKLAVAVAGYSPGEADQLRRDMAAWRSSGRIELHRDRILRGMLANGIEAEFAERVFSQIQGFGEYGFPESHAASFALIAYVTSWLRCHHLAAFTCSLLNAQPMGFYSPATIVDDARRHGLRVLPVDVSTSSWDCTIEPDPLAQHRFSLRMGFRWVKGFGEREKARLAAAPGPYPTLDDFVRRTRLHRNRLNTLAEAGAFSSFGVDRRDAIWTIRGLCTTREDTMAFPADGTAEDEPRFARLSSGEAILWDYRTSMHSARGHPLEPLRAELRRRKLPDAEAVSTMPNGRRVRYVGLVICRQRPATASGVTFFTLEDETGFVNLVVWKNVFERHAWLAKSSLLLGVTGQVQAAEGVVHLVAESLWEPDLPRPLERSASRDFH